MRLATTILIAISLGTLSLAACKSKTTANAAASASGPVATAPAAASTRPGAPSMPAIQGKVLEITEVANYTYLYLDTTKEKVWVAVPKTTVAVGDQVTVERPMEMKNFKSPSLNKEFETIYFGVIPGSAAASVAMPPHPTPAASVPKDINVPKAKGANAYTVEEIAKESAKLNGKPVVIQGMVVKVNSGIMEKNWVHIQDGTGAADAKTNDLLVTTTGEPPKQGEVVLVKGKVVTDKNFGSGYSYKFMVEEATITPAKP
jgi:hypothetical protein